MTLQDSIRFHAETDVGRRRNHNEDNYLVDKKLGLFVVADGMGGHAAGEVASALAVRTVHEELKKDSSILQDFALGAKGASRVSTKEVLNLLEYSLQRACARIYEQGRQDVNKRGMGTTLSLVLLLGGRGFIAHVGDSRIYLWRAGKVQQLTEDHTVSNELIKRGKLTRAQIEKVGQKHAITRALGVYEQVEVDTLSFDVLPGDNLLLCSDGLHGYFEDLSELGTLLSSDDIEVLTKKLVMMALDRGGKDNVTAVVVHIGEGSEQDEVRARQIALQREVLSNMTLFKPLSERELLRVMQVAELRRHRDNDILIKENDTGDELFIVLSGRVEVIKGDSILTTLGQGEHFGEMALIRNQPRSATVRSAGDSDIIAVRRADFFDILRTEHAIAVKLLWQFLGVLGDRLDRTSNDLQSAREEIDSIDITSEVFAMIEDTEADDPDDRATNPLIGAVVG